MGRTLSLYPALAPPESRVKEEHQDIYFTTLDRLSEDREVLKLKV